MNDSQRRRSERLERVRTYMTEHASDFPQESKGGQAAARLHNILNELRMLVSSRAAKKGEQRQASIGRRDEREVLYEQITAIRDTAETVGLDHPEVRGIFKWSRTRMSDQSLLATAQATAQNAARFESLFMEYDMPPDFLDKLEASIGSFDQHINRQTATKSSGVAATAALETTLKRAEEEVERLDTAVRNKFRDDPARMAAWESASRLERAPRRPAADNKTGGTPPAP